MTTFYIAASNRMSWGRGTKEWEAIGHAIDHADEASTIILFEVKCPEGSGEHQIYVNEMGSIVAPPGTEVKELCQIKHGAISAFISYKQAIDEWISND